MNGCKNIDKEVNNIEIKKIIQGKNGKTYICIYMPEMLRYFSLRSIYIYIYLHIYESSAGRMPRHAIPLRIPEQPWKHACPERFRKNIPETIFSQAMSRMKNISVVLLAVEEKIQEYRFINIEKS